MLESCLPDLSKHDLKQVPESGFMIDKLRVAGVMKINSKRSEVFIFDNSGHEEFIKFILLLFCFAQRLSFPCDTQKRESVVIRLN